MACCAAHSGLKMGLVSKPNFEARVLELVGDRAMWMRALNPS